MGPMGSGKTRLGKRVAKLLGVPFIDTDKRIVAEHGPITAIFENDGEARFRQLEREAVAEALAERAVVSLGGGAVLDPATQDALAAHRVVYLTVDSRAVLARMDTSKRPLLKDGPEAWEKIFAERKGIYERLASVTFDTSARPITHIAQDIAAWARGRNPEATP
ncbi:shikimate kinase [Paramicrobacterium humi]|nr:shikimate kinase [Microbacterium humi]